MTELWEKYTDICISKLSNAMQVQSGGKKQMKKLGFGLMRLPLINDEFDCIDKEMLCSMVDLYSRVRSVNAAG